MTTQSSRKITGRSPEREPQKNEVELSIVMPCLNEARTLGTVIEKANRFLTERGISGEIIVADNGSSDGSQSIATSKGALVVEVKERGYGNALMAGFRAAKGKFIIMGDSDDSYRFDEAMPFVDKLRAGCDLVMGNRLNGGIQKGAMRWLHRYIGNPVLSGLGRFLFRTSCHDFHCGLRGFRREAILGLDLKSPGMEFASEMVVKASLYRLKMTEVDVRLYPDGRNRAPHLQSWRDGWRHLRLLLVFNPRWLFFIPGTALVFLGFASGVWLLPGPRRVGNAVFDVHSLIYCTVAIIIGYQSIVFAALTEVYSVTARIVPNNGRMRRLFHPRRLEAGVAIGFLLQFLGVAGSIGAVLWWKSLGFGPLNYEITLRMVIPCSLLMTIGYQTVLAGFFLGVLQLGENGTLK